MVLITLTTTPYDIATNARTTFIHINEGQPRKSAINLVNFVRDC